MNYILQRYYLLIGNWYTETLRTNSSIQKSYVRHLALKSSALISETNWYRGCLVNDLAPTTTCYKGSFLMTGWDVWAKKVRKIKCWMGLMGCKSPCLLVLADEKITELGSPLWSELGKAGGDFHGRGEPTLGNCTKAVVFAGERQKNPIQGHWMCFGF